MPQSGGHARCCRRPELTPEACRAARRLKAQKMFYVLTVLIDDETAGEVMQDDWLESMAQETLCCMCARKPGTSDETAREAAPQHRERTP